MSNWVGPSFSLLIYQHKKGLDTIDIICYTSVFSKRKLLRCVFFRPDGKREVVPLDPPSGSKIGDRVTVEGYEHDKLGGTEYGCDLVNAGKYFIGYYMCTIIIIMRLILCFVVSSITV